MKIFKKIISATVIVCFLGSNIAQAGGGDVFTLAAPSKFAHLQGPEFKEVAQIEIGIRQSLKDLELFNLDVLKALGAKEFKENTVFGARIAGKIRFDQTAEVQIPSSRIYAEKGSYLVKADTGGRTYYCLLAKTGDPARYDVSVVSERVLNIALEKGTVKFTGESLNEEDRGILNAYIEHEASTGNNETIDEWIKERMVRGAYAVDNITAKENPLYKHAQRDTYDREKYTGLLDHMAEFLNAAGVENVEAVVNAMRSKPLIFMPHATKDDLPRINIDGRPVVVNAHSSQFATYILVPQALYETIKQAQPLSDTAAGYIETLLVHETGARCGLKANVKSGEFRNVLDEYFAAYKNKKSWLVDEIPEEIKNLAPVNLLELQLRNDYAAGSGMLKFIFMAAIALIVAVQGCGPAQETVVVAPVEEQTGQEKITEAWIRQLGSLKAYDRQVAMEHFLSSPVQEPEIEMLIEALREEGLYVPGLAALVLGKIGNELALQPLLEAFRSGPIYVRVSAALALGELGCEEALQPLKVGMKDEDPRIRVASVEALSKYKDEDAIQSIGEALTDRNLSVREAAKKALSKRQGTPIEEEVQRLMRDLKSGQDRTREFAVNDLIGMDGKEALQPLIEALEYEKEDVRRAAARVLGEKRYEEAVIPLAEAYKNEDDYFTRIVFVEALSKIGGEAAVQVLTEISNNNTETRVSEAAVKALGEMQEVEVYRTTVEEEIQFYIEKLTNGNMNYSVDRNREIAVRVLSEKRYEEAVQPLVELLKHENKYVRRDAAQVLGEMGYEEAVIPLAEAYKNEDYSLIRGGFVEALEKIGGEAAVQALTEISNNETETRVSEAADKALGRMQGIEVDRVTIERVIQFYIEELTNGNMNDNVSPIRERAVRVLSEITDKEAVQPLAELLKHENKYVRRDAARVLGAIGSEEAVIPLTEAYKNEDDDNSLIRVVYIEALSKIGGETAVQVIKEIVTTETETRVSEAADKALGEMQEVDRTTVEEAIQLYIEELKSGNRNYSVSPNREIAVRALSKMADKATVQPLVELLKHENKYVHRDAAQILGAMGYEEAVIPLTEAYKNEDDCLIRLVYIEALGKIGGEPAIQLIRKALKEDKELLVREAAERALIEMGVREEEAVQPRSEVQEKDESKETSSLDKSSERPEKAAIAGLARINEPLNQAEVFSRIDEISEVLWQQARGEITEEKAKAELAELAPNVTLNVWDRDAVYDTWMTYAASITLFLGLGAAGKHKKPQDADIRAVAAVIADKEIEIFMPESQFPKNVTRPFRNALNDIFGDRLRTYQNLDDLNKMVKNPGKSIIMTVDLKAEQIDSLNSAGLDLDLMRFMNFSPVNIGEMTQAEHENYIAETLSMLLVARAITPEEAQDPGAVMYQMLAHFLESHMQDAKEVGAYISTMVSGSINAIDKLKYLLKTVLQAVPITFYKIMKPAVQILWSA